MNMNCYSDLACNCNLEDTLGEEELQDETYLPMCAAKTLCTFILILYFSWKVITSFSLFLTCFSKFVAICNMIP